MMLRTLWQLLERRQKVTLLALQLMSVLMAVLTVVGIAAILPFLTVLADPGAVDRSAAMRFLFRRLHLAAIGGGAHSALALGGVFISLVTIANAVNLGGSLLLNRFALKVGDAFNSSLFQEYLARPYEFHLATHSATLSARLLHESRRVTVGVLQSVLMLGANLVTIALIVGSMVLIDPLVAALALALLGTTYGLIYVAASGKLLRNGAEETRHHAERARIVAESLGAIKEILLLRAQPAFARRFATTCGEISRTMLSTLAIAQAPRHVLEIATVCALVGSTLFLSGGGARTPWIAALSFMAFAIYRLLPALQQAFVALVRIRADRPALDNIAEDIHHARAREALARVNTGADTGRMRPAREIRLENVSFRYAAHAPQVLSGLSLCVPAGAIVGIVGENGSGKSTLLDVLAGLLVPQSGVLSVDGVVVDASNRDAWQSAISYVSQQVALLDATLAENIALGAAGSLPDAQCLQNAVRVARLADCARALSERGCERLGERGGRLSGGQRQRVGLARAFYRGGSVLILDEATSELDAAAEESIVDALQAIRAGRTIILTGHRISSLRHCDVILELERGRLVRSSTYAELRDTKRPAVV
ncbi:MAG TPA: ABC transporter ATP-binding protein [Steroidobacteraceae bacterium]|nr:ABC transporter ATP-binding protein [Steroidobacteraceae bacterium]